jgi:hypothetical protein
VTADAAAAGAVLVVLHVSKVLFTTRAEQLQG